mmetsp:Transcript_6383/g.7301  ORF Transcript_6383/g.7301 Transcript_6383/m.7301 type:complete len:276 (+) Transcript_6383:250-1077(+)
MAISRLTASFSIHRTSYLSPLFNDALHRFRFVRKTHYSSQREEDDKISVYINWSNNLIHLYKDSHDAFEVREDLKRLISQDICGIFMDSVPMFSRDNRNLKTICDIAPSPDFLIFARHSNSSLQKSSILLCDYNKSLDDTRNILTQSFINGRKTTIAIPNPITSDYAEHCEVASEVATLINTSNGGGNYVWIRHHEDSNYTIRLCKELLCKNLQHGPKMKSRLVVDTMDGNHSIVKECMMMGINKFVVDSTDQVRNCIKVIAKDLGKKVLSLEKC